MHKIGIWGQFGDGGVIADGQAVRTTVITKELERRYGSESIIKVNTNKWNNHKVSFFINSIKLLISAENIVIFPADNGFKVIVPLFTYLNIICKKKLLYVVIGGFLPELLQHHPSYIGFLKKFKTIFVQTHNIKTELNKLGVNNIKYITNLKRIESVNKDEIRINNNKFKIIDT